MKIKDICSRMIVVAPRGTSLRAAARLMRDHHVGALIVVDDGDERITRPLGIVTDRDIVVAVVAADDVAPDSLTVEDVMARELALAQADDGLFEAIDAMHDKGVRRLPVVGADGRLVGIVTVDDVLRVLANELAGVAMALQRSGQRETALRPALAAGA